MSLENFASKTRRYLVTKGFRTPMVEVMPLAAGDLFQFSIAKGLGDRTIHDRLELFRQENMEGSRATQALLSIFAPLPTTIEDHLHLLNQDNKESTTLEQQLNWIATPKQKSSITSLQYFALESLVNKIREHKLHGEDHQLSEKTIKLAQEIFEEYGIHLKKVFDIDNLVSAGLMDKSILIGKVGVAISPLLIFAACSLFTPKPSSKSIVAEANLITSTVQAPISGGFVRLEGAPPGPFVLGPSQNYEKKDSVSINLKDMTDARALLERKGGANWIQGDPKDEITYFPWKTAETWNIFRNLTSVGLQPHDVLLFPNSTGTEFTLIGVETINGKVILDFVDNDNNPRSIALDKKADLEEILGNSYNDLWDKSIAVWPDMSYPSGNCPSPAFDSPSPGGGVTEGFTCTLDGKRGHFFQAQSRLRKK